jgi:NADPH:quinone reductase-like Zn-dependent oxidoreductase
VDVAQKHFEGGLKGRTVLVPAGLSGTGSCAVQVAKNMFGAGNVITTLSPSKAAKVESLLGKGVVDRVIDYTKEDMATVIERGSVDFMFDTMGQALASLHLMKPGGLIVSVGSLPFGKELKTVATDMPTVVRWILNGIGAVSQWRARRYGVTYQSLFMHPSAEDLTRLGRWADEGKVKPIVGRVARFDNLEDIRSGCQEILNAKGGTGKFVIQIL